MKKLATISVFILILLILYNISLSAYEIELNNIIYVDDDNIEGPWDGSQTYPFCRIQDAVNNSSNGDIVIVYDGFYIENVFINIPLTLQGIDKNTTIIDGNGIKDCIYLSSNADGAIITGFTIQNSGNNSSGGFFDEGIDIHASNTIITNNIIKNHQNNGIWLWCSTKNNISYNVIKNNHRAGIEANDLRNSNIYRNQFTDNYEWGVMLHADGISIDNYIIENTFIENFKGMCLVRQAGNFILRNNFIRNNGGNARSDLTFFSRSSEYTNNWDQNYWDDSTNKEQRRISGIFSFDIDWNPVDVPYQLYGGE
jgi:parallel beta-helix repeat protein